MVKNVKLVRYEMVRYDHSGLWTEKTVHSQGQFRGTPDYIRHKLGEIANFCKHTGFRLTYTIEV